MEAESFEEHELYAQVARSGARALLIGRRAMIVLGAPVNTGDTDYWLHIDDIERFNGVARAFDVFPGATPDQARARGRYVLENGEKIDVMVARDASTVDGVRVLFDDVWARRQHVEIAPGAFVEVPSLPDLILTKRFAARPKDAEDLRWLQLMLERQGR